MLVEAIVRKCREWLFRGRRDTWITGAAWRGRGFGADDGGGTVDLAEVCERDREVHVARPGCLQLHGARNGVVEGGEGSSADCGSSRRAERGVAAAPSEESVLEDRL